MSRLLVVVPTYEERPNLEALCTGVLSVLPEARLLVVDDASPDGTGDLADDLARRDERITVLHRPEKRGLASAYLDGFRQGLTGGYEAFVQMDADLSHDPGHLPRLLEALEGGTDLVIGSRRVAGGGIRGWGPGRRILSRGGSLYARAWLGLSVRDPTSGFRALRRRVLETVEPGSLRCEGYAFLVEMAYRAAAAGLRVVEVPIVFTDRGAGHSKMTFAIFLEAVVKVPLLRWRVRPGRPEPSPRSARTPPPGRPGR